jgi:hypothetical protein
MKFTVIHSNRVDFLGFAFFIACDSPYTCDVRSHAISPYTNLIPRLTDYCEKDIQLRSEYKFKSCLRYFHLCKVTNC